jgi:hypothetical protein
MINHAAAKRLHQQFLALTKKISSSDNKDVQHIMDSLLIVGKLSMQAIECTEEIKIALGKAANGIK